MVSCDLGIVGGGIVGLATAYAWLRRFPGSSVEIYEKEPAVGLHQTGHNSGVIHSGIYYRPGSLKARLCQSGSRRLLAFCKAEGIPYRLSGKVIVATAAHELPLLKALYERGLANGIEGLDWIGPERLRELEPQARGVQAIHVPHAGVVDYRIVSAAMANRCRQLGGVVRTATAVRQILHRDGVWVLETTKGQYRTRFLITCGGLQADRLARMAKAPGDMQIIPFRGEYYDLVERKQALINSMIYPVPQPGLPFLGVHLTRGIDDRVHAGPNAVLALKREGYRKTDVDLRDVGGLLGSSCFWRMASIHWRTGIAEMLRSASKNAFLRAVQRLVPAIEAGDLLAGGSGVRAQAVRRDGTLVDDFDIIQGRQAIYVRNVPSPAATASLAIGEKIAAMAAAAGGNG